MKGKDFKAQVASIEDDEDVMIAVVSDNPRFGELPDVYNISYFERSGEKLIFIKAFKDECL